ncbi:MAG: chemotaxis protein CheW [Campylobacterota bacterium]|nr:chemotaxis protein CheW [Campylobacterota bacterium]
MQDYEELEDITKMGQVDDDEEDELDLIKLVNTNANDTSQYLIFVGSDDQYYAKNVSKIEELLVYKDLEIVKNNNGGLIVGTADIRGNMTTIINYDRWFGNEVLDDKDYELIILAHYGGHRIGIMVKRVEYIVNIPSETMTDNSENNDKTSFITKVQVSGKDVLCSIFDSDKMLLDVFDKIDAQSHNQIGTLKPLGISDKKVIFADDSRFIRKMVQELFDTLDVKYEIYDDGQQMVDALKHLELEDIALFITDLEMPVLGGREVVRIIREDKKYDSIKLIVHTNMSNGTMEETLLGAGVDRIIGKVNMLKLGDAIKELII